MNKIKFQFLAGFLTGVLLTSIYNNPTKTKKVINSVIDFVSKHKQDVPQYQEDVEESYQRELDLAQGWDNQ